MCANCKALDSTAIIPISIDNVTANSVQSSNNPYVSKDINVDDIDLDSLSLYVEDICLYIAGFVVKTGKKISCQLCKNQIYYKYHTSCLDIKTEEVLKKSSKCKIAKNIFRQYNTFSIINTENKFSLMINRVKNVLYAC